jgi:hypothetical protein
VADGFIKLEGPMFRQRFEREFSDAKPSPVCYIYHADTKSKERESESYHKSWPSYTIYSDGPFCEVVRQDTSKTVRRLRSGEACRSFRVPLDCLGLCRILRRLHVALILGQSVTVPGAYERLGILRWFVTEAENPIEELKAIARCYKDAEIKAVTIV